MNNKTFHKAKKDAARIAKRLAPVYAVLNWEWYVEDVGLKVPQAERIEEEIIRLIESAKIEWSKNKDEETAVSSGGIEISICDNELRIAFIDDHIIFGESND